LFVATRVVSDAGRQAIDVDSPWFDDSMRALSEAGVAHRCGTLLTTDEPLLLSSQKLQAGARHGASIVDLEGHAIASQTAEWGVHLVTVRVALDEAALDLPQFVRDIIADGGRREWLHTLRAMRNPETLRTLLPLARRSRRATAILRRAASVLVPFLSVRAALDETASKAAQ
jgi:nucleoside phosphorylase